MSSLGLGTVGDGRMVTGRWYQHVVHVNHMSTERQTGNNVMGMDLR
jgi:hypothetical protein